MTPSELDAIEARAAKAFPAIDYKRDSDADMPALCTALRTAWAELETVSDELYVTQVLLKDARELLRDSRPSPEVVAKVREALLAVDVYCLSAGDLASEEDRKDAEHQTNLVNEALRLLKAGAK